ncbi:unnamed protein product [Prunus armeniaca]
MGRNGRIEHEIEGCVYMRERKKVEEQSMKLNDSSSERMLLALDEFARGEKGKRCKNRAGNWRVLVVREDACSP